MTRNRRRSEWGSILRWCYSPSRNLSIRMAFAAENELAFSEVPSEPAEMEQILRINQGRQEPAR
jgi:hypothetical protein